MSMMSGCQPSVHSKIFGITNVDSSHQVVFISKRCWDVKNDRLPTICASKTIWDSEMLIVVSKYFYPGMSGCQG